MVGSSSLKRFLFFRLIALKSTTGIPSTSISTAILHQSLNSFSGSLSTAGGSEGRSEGGRRQWKKCLGTRFVRGVRYERRSPHSRRYQSMKSMIGNATDKSISIDIDWYQPIDDQSIVTKKVIDWQLSSSIGIDWQFIHRLASIGNSFHDRCSRGSSK